MEEIQRQQDIAAAASAEAREEAIRSSMMERDQRREARRQRVEETREAFGSSMMELEREIRARRQRLDGLSEATRAALLRTSEDEIRKERGASEAAIEKLEVVADYGLDRNGEDCCSICLAEMGGRVIRMECKHVFHQSCLMKWLKTSKSCPLCRFQVSD